MKKGWTAATNAALALVIAAVAAVCFFPMADPAAGLDEKAVRKGTSADGVSLMFNVYWGTEEVYGILGALDEYGAKATFFLGGSWADDNVPCVKEIVARGHEIGSHGYFHRDHAALDYEENVREIAASVQFLSLAAGTPVTLFAPPSGSFSDDTLTAAENMGLKTILWSKDTVDWRDKDADVCYRRATQDVQGGDLILMHPMPHTVQALPRILAAYREKGLRAVTVGENLG